MPDQTLHGPRGAVRQSAYRVQFYLFRKLPQHVYLVYLGVTFYEPAEKNCYKTD